MKITISDKLEMTQVQNAVDNLERTIPGLCIGGTTIVVDSDEAFLSIDSDDADEPLDDYLAATVWRQLCNDIGR